MNTLEIVPNEAGALARPYKNSPEHGYMLIQSKTATPQAGGEWISINKRTHLLKGKVEELKDFVKEYASITSEGAKLPGRISITEVLEDAVPENLAKRFKEGVTLEEAIEPFLKRKGKDGAVLTKDGKRILRFTSYDMAGASTDTLIEHDGEA